jgi:hypothetical protein
MNLYALPEDTLNRVMDLLQELPVKTSLNVISEVQKAILVVDSNGKPIPAASAQPASVTQNVTTETPTVDLNQLPL